MRLTKTKRWAIRGSVLAAALICGAFAACKAEGPPRPTCNDVIDGGARDALAIVPYTTLTTDAQPPTTYGMDPDPGPQCVDCTLDSEFEIMTISDFEDGFAPAWFNYGEPGVLIEPPQAGQAVDEAGVTTTANPPPPYWGLQVATLANTPGGERCGSKFALHMEGGRFVAWGGGYVTRHFITRGEFMNRVAPGGQVYCSNMRPMQGDPLKNGVGTAPNYMPPGTTRAESATGCMFWASPVAGQPSLLGVDVSDFDGVSFWARRGPSGQSSLRVALVDDNTSEDLALQVERDAYKEGIPPDQAGARCERIEGCCRKCDDELSHQEYVAAPTGSPPTEATFRTVSDSRCHIDGERMPEFRYKTVTTADGGTAQQPVAWDFRDEICGDTPKTEDLSDPCWVLEADQVWDSWDTDFGLCCPITMEEEAAINNEFELNGDPRWGGKPCRPYVFQFDYSSGNYCHDEGDVLPERNQNRCGEGFEASIVIDTEWKLFRVPWAELRRYTPDKPPFDPHSVWQVSFYFGQGYLDTYLDDVGFYRTRR